jgi:hypothetical protein
MVGMSVSAADALAGAATALSTPRLHTALHGHQRVLGADSIFRPRSGDDAAIIALHYLITGVGTAM